jgi:protein-tyrosine-phosphatase
MAEALFDQLAQGKARALSAGTDPGDAVDHAVVRVMQEVGIDLSTKKPKALTPEMVDHADKVVTMGCGVEGMCPATWVETEDWELEDPKGKSLEQVRKIRDEIKERVGKLVKEILPI